MNATDAPAPSAAAARTATCGELTATIAATSAGAVTTATSKTIETIAYAVSRWSASSTSAPHTERIAAGTCGNVAPPHSAQSASTQVGACSLAAITSAASAGTCPRAAARSTRVCPSRSMSRPCATAPSAFARLKAPTTRPATANEPVASWASSRMPRPNMPIGIDPAADRITGARAPGRASSDR